MLIQRLHPAAYTHKWGIFSQSRVCPILKTTYNIRLDAQPIKLLLVITPGFGRVIGDEEDAFLCTKERRIGSSGSVSQNAGEGE